MYSCIYYNHLHGLLMIVEVLAGLLRKILIRTVLWKNTEKPKDVVRFGHLEHMVQVIRVMGAGYRIHSQHLD